MQEEEYTFVTLDGNDAMPADAVLVDVDNLDVDLSEAIIVEDMDFMSEIASDTELEIAKAIFFSNSSISISPFMALLISSTNDVYQSSPIKLTFLSPCIDSNRLSTEDAVFTISF